MPRILLFCLAEEAKPFARTVLNFDHGEAGRIFYLVESRVCPDNRDGFKAELRDDETFETEFIGATVQECQSWARQYQYQRKFIERDIIAIIDARSAADNTLSMQFYASDLDPPEPALEFGEYGVLPRVCNIWYDFRIDYQGCFEVWTSLNYGSPDGVYPVYFGRKEELTDEHGVFNVVEARRLVRGEV